MTAVDIRSLVLLCVTVISLGAVVAKLRDAQRSPSPGLRVLCGALVLMLTVEILGNLWLDRFTPLHLFNLRQVLYSGLSIVMAATLQSAFLYMSVSPQEARRRARLRAIVALVSVVALVLAALYGISGRWQVPGALGQLAAAKPGIGEFYLIYIAALGFALIDIVRAAVSYFLVRGVRGAVGLGLLLTTAGAVSFLVHVGYRLYMTLGLRFDLYDPGKVNSPLLGITFSVGCAGIAIGMTTATLQRRWLRHRDQVNYQRLTPLREAIRQAFPEVALAGKDVPVQSEPEFLLTRAVIEIRDGYLLLGRWLRTDIADAPDAGSPQYEAAIILAALRARADGVPARDDADSVALRGHSNLAEEVEWLTQVSEAFDQLSRRSPAAAK